MKSNFFPIFFDFSEFDIQRVPYKDGLLHLLRQNHNKSHSFFRRGDYIYISPGTAEAETLGETVRLQINEHPDIVSSLIKHIFFRTIRSAQPDLHPEFYPFRFAARKTDFDLARRNLPDSLKDVLTFKRITEVQFRDNRDNSGQFIFGALINHSYRWQLSLSCQDLINSAFDLIGREVISDINDEPTDSVAMREMSLLGRIREIRDNQAFVDTNNGLSPYPLSSLYLRNSNENINAFLSSDLGEYRARQILENIKELEVKKMKLSVVMEEIEAMGKWLAGQAYYNFDSFGFTITRDNRIKTHDSFSMNEPSLIFDISKARVHQKPSIGLNTYGPYSKSIGFSNNSPRILVLFHQRNAALYTEFLANLRDGIPNHIWFSSGMVHKYRLTNITYHIEELIDYSVESYLNAINRALKREHSPFDLAIVESSDDFRELSNEKNPYFRVRVHLLMQGTGVQFIRPTTIRDPSYTIDGIALQLYAKLGGIPWTVPVDQSVDRELVIGIGSAILRKNHFSGNSQARYVGITTFFAADGKYLANSRTKNVPYEDYFEELLENLKEMIDRLSNEYSWNERDRVRLVFHIFKPIKNLEAAVVEALVSKYQQYEIRFAFVTISERHPYILYDEEQAGNNGKGANVPKRGFAFPIGERACLLHLLGVHEVRTSRHGVPTPVLIRIHEKSTFFDLQYIVQQVFKFSRLSFRSFNPSYAPVTLLYANLITRQLKDLRGLPGWDSSAATLQLRQKKWFL